MSRRETRNETVPTDPSPAPAATPPTNSPLRVFRARGVSVAVFRNQVVIEGREVTLLKAEVRRVYRDGEQFKTTHALSPNDVPVARLLLEQAFAFMIEANQERSEADDNAAR